ncbi:MAG: hypothetical protein EOO10_17070 [Chitinophagaceae bacterium]|nr:MAG: hypothetical protein EOO10_17070 [Chitinophagaceae bacterium]
MTLRFYIFFVLSLLLSVEGWSQLATNNKSRLDSLQKLKTVLRERNVVSSPLVGYAGGNSPYWHSFAFLTLLSNQAELLEMTHDKSPAVRLYGYIGLLHKKYVDTASVRKRLSSDTAQVVSFVSCVVDEITVAQGLEEIYNWYDEKRTAETIALIQTDQKYRTHLYRALIGWKPIKRR